jgi:hypothetical protein
MRKITGIKVALPDQNKTPHPAQDRISGVTDLGWVGFFVFIFVESLFSFKKLASQVSAHLQD